MCSAVKKICNASIIKENLGDCIADDKKQAAKQSALV